MRGFVVITAISQISIGLLFSRISPAAIQIKGVHIGAGPLWRHSISFIDITPHSRKPHHTYTTIDLLPPEKPMEIPESPEEAMNSALASEQAAEESLRQCSAQAAEELALAREKARRIAARTDARISKLHTSCSMNNTRRIRSLESEEASESGHWSEAELRNAMSEAISRVAAQLTGEVE
jgi:hypothetical protein